MLWFNMRESRYIGHNVISPKDYEITVDDVVGYHIHIDGNIQRKTFDCFND